MLADGHNHTLEFSPDAKMTIDELISAATAKKLTAVGITEHYELENPDPEDNIQTYDLDLYDRTFEEWRAKCPKELKLLKGIEFGYQTKTGPEIDRIAAEHDFDTVILSNHLFRGVDVYFSEEAHLVPKNERHAEYIGIMAEMCERLDNYTVAGHYDYISRDQRSSAEDSFVLYEDCPKEFDRLFEALISKEKSLEINPRSILKIGEKGSKRIFPDDKILKRYKDMGGKLISLGSDSHTPDTLGLLFPETIEYLKSLGFSEACYFVKKRPVIEPF